MTVKIASIDEAIELLTAVVEEKGSDYIYRAPNSGGRCQYFHGVEPGCIIGHVLARLGVTAADVGSRMDHTVEALCHAFNSPVNASVEVIKVLRMAQRVQDQGNPWGEALAAAKEEAAFQKTLEGKR